jgi:hypothetical protein
VEPSDVTMGLCRRRLLVVGDSVVAGAVQELERLHGWRVFVDARECRQVARRVDGCGTTDIPSGLDAMGEGVRRARPDAAVVHLGHNGRLEPAHVDALMDVADVDLVVWVTLRQPQEWEWSNNDVIREAVARRPTAVLADWHARSEGQPWFADDGVHVTRRGAAALAQLVASTLPAAPGPYRMVGRAWRKVQRLPSRSSAT